MLLPSSPLSFWPKNWFHFLESKPSLLLRKVHKKHALDNSPGLWVVSLFIISFCLRVVRFSAFNFNNFIYHSKRPNYVKAAFGIKHILPPQRLPKFGHKLKIYRTAFGLFFAVHFSTDICELKLPSYLFKSKISKAFYSVNQNAPQWIIQKIIKLVGKLK